MKAPKPFVIAGGAIAALIVAAGAFLLLQHPRSEAPAEKQGYRSDFAKVDDNPVGKRVYETVCAACHDHGVDRAPSPSTLGLLAPESILRALTSGVMQAQAASLSDEERRRVAEYVARLGAATASLPPAPRCEGRAAQFNYGEPPVFANWGLSAGGTRLVPTALAGVDRANVQRLKLKWAFAFPNAVRARSNPMLAGGAIYVGSHDGTVYALDRETGCVRWTYAAGAEVRTAILVSPWRAGDRNARPLAFFGDVLGNVRAVDARTGEEVWRDRADAHPTTMITGTPTLHEGKLYVPVSSLELIPAADPRYECCTFRGSLVAYDAASGRRLWQSYTIPEEPKAQRANRVGTMQRGPSGAPIWNTPVIDAARGQIYVGTGENYSSPANNTSDSVIAFDIATGRIKWVYQALANDAFNASCVRPEPVNCPRENGPDFDFGASVILAHASDGRDLVLAGQKSGMVYALDPATGRVGWQKRVGRGGIMGGVHFGMAVNGDALFVPIDDQNDSRTYPHPDAPGLYALDIRNGDALWRAPAENVCRGRALCHPGIGGAITTTPELVFAGASDGVMRAYDTRTGRVLWSFDTVRDFPTLGGGSARGGSFGGQAAAMLYRGHALFNSGYGFSGKMPGNVLLMFEVE